MTVKVEIPDQCADQFPASAADCARGLLEAYVLLEFSEERMTSGQLGKVLGLSFQQTEEFLHAHHAPPGLGPGEHLRGVRNLERTLAS